MLKVITFKKFLIAIFTIVVLFISVQFMNLKIYETNGGNLDLVINSGITYQRSPELSTKYSSGEIKAERIIGRLKEELFGFKVSRLKGFG